MGGHQGPQVRPCAVVGIDRYPLRINGKMGAKLRARRSRIKPFVKHINYNHVMPTRYSLDIESKPITHDKEGETRSFTDATQRKAAVKAAQEILQARFNTGKNKWFFTKLRF